MTKKMTKAEIDRRMAMLDGAIGAAGHELKDSYVRDLLRKNIAGEISSDEYRELVNAHIFGK